MVKFAFLVLGLSSALCANAQEKKQEKEQEASEALSIPALSLDAQRYSRFYSSEQFEFAVDPESISIPGGDDNEVRYILRATSKQGAINFNYEGIRCGSRQHILYAVGVVKQDEGNWTQAGSPQWKKIYATGNNLQHVILANDFFCSGNALSDSLESIRRRIKSNRPLSNY